VTHLGEEIAALVDGELSHDARDRALAHLAGCPQCRADVEAERRTKAMITRIERVQTPASLVARLRELPVELTAPHGLRAGAAWLVDRRRRPTSRRPAGGRPRGAARRRRRRISAATSGAVMVGAFVAALLVGGGPDGGERSVTPPVDQFTVEHAAVTPEVPLSDQGGPASVVSFPSPSAP
jgi:anti-sigma factor RsiW